MYLGVDIGGTKTLVAVLNAHGEIIESVKFLTPQVYAEFLNEFAKSIALLTTNNFIACCVAVPGRLDRKRGIGIAFGNLPWQNVPIRDNVKKLVHCPVVIENDAKLAGLSESMLLKQYERVLYITLSTGIGTGFIVNQTIDPDLVDSEAGKMILEHNGKMQTWESFASGKAIVRRFGRKAKDITDAHTWQIIAHDVAIGLIELIAVIQPQVIVFGGSVNQYFDRFGNYLVAELKKYETPLSPIPPLRQAARPNEAVVYGCYDLAKSLHEHTH